MLIVGLVLPGHLFFIPQKNFSLLLAGRLESNTVAHGVLL